VIAVPPLFAGGIHVTVSDPTPDVAVTPVGASGAALVVTDPEADDAVEVP
jgi:hypothetical protein